MNEDRDALAGEVERLRGVQRDLEARLRRAEDALHQSRALHAATIESLPFDFWARDREGYCFSQNGTTLANWGDLLGKRPEDMDMPAEVVEVWLSNNRRALAGEVVAGDHQYTLLGEVRSIHNVLAPIRMGDAIVGTLGVNIDVTDQKRAISALREGEEKLRLAAEASGIGFCSCDLRTGELSWDPPLSSLLGLSPEVAPRTAAEYLQLLHPDDRDRVAQAIQEGFGNGEWEDEHRIVRPNGTDLWVLAKGRRVRSDGRDLVVGAMIDVTERRRQDERLRQAQKLEAVGQLTAGIAHNFNNMLMGVLPALELAQAKAPADLVPLLRTAENSAMRAAKLVRELLVYTGRHRPSARAIEPLAPLVERTVTLCRTTFDARIALEARCDPAAAASLDASQLEQVLLNLLLNARDAVSGSAIASPRIGIDVDVVPGSAPDLEGRSGDHVRLRVSDNGVGMDRLTQARMFEPFFTTKSGKGTGLGLATTLTIVMEHGGFIGCESSQGKGTSMSIWLPAAFGSAPPDPVPPGPPRLPLGHETVLVVDDEPQVRDVVAQMLGNAGYTALLAASGDEAVALLADRGVAGSIAAVLLDVSLPGMPRSALRAHLRRVAPQAPVIAFTGYPAQDIGDDDPIVEKPASASQLLGAIRAALSR